MATQKRVNDTTVVEAGLDRHYQRVLHVQKFVPKKLKGFTVQWWPVILHLLKKQGNKETHTMITQKEVYLQNLTSSYIQYDYP